MRRRTWRTMGAALLVAVLPLSAVAGGAAQAAPDQVATAGGRTVTLVTGDRVTVAEDGPLVIERGKGRAGVRFLTQRRDGHLEAIPSDALPALAAGRVDRRLFDVTLLLEYGYDKLDHVPLILTGSAASRSLAASGGARVRDLPAVHGFATHAAKDTAFWAGLRGGASALAATGTTIWLDAKFRPTLEQSVPQIGAPTAWQAGYDGTGMRVAIIDTGADVNHPDLVGQIAEYQTFGAGDGRDTAGHGTHIASTIAGTGAASGGRYRGVAPGAKLLIADVDDLEESVIIEAMQWAAEQGATAVNMSFGGPDSAGVDPIEQAVNALSAQYGTLFVVGTGNDGEIGVGTPGSADAGITVAPVDKSDNLASFATVGPRVDGGLKPDIAAPGVDIVAARSQDSPGSGSYVSFSGTSMAIPHVVGSAAVLGQRHPDWSGAQLKAGLMGSAKPNPATDVYGQGAGRVDVARAVSQQVIADPPSVDLGRQAWPHTDDTAVARTVIYHNDGAADATLALSLDARGPDGNPLPAGVFSLSASTVTVPAGGQASVTVTADTRVATPDGFLRGRLVATGDGTVVQTPFAVDKEVESYDVAVMHTGRDPQLPDQFYETVLASLDPPGADQPGFRLLFGSDPEHTFRVPRGRYAVLVRQAAFSPDPASVPQFSVLAQPRLDVTSTQRVVADGRMARPHSITPSRSTVSQLHGYVSATVTTAGEPYLTGIDGPTLDGIHSAALGSTRPVDGFFAQVGGTWARLDQNGNPHNSPEVHNLAWLTKGRMITGASHRVRDGDLATVVGTFAAQNAGATGWKAAFLLPPGLYYVPPAAELPFDLPFTRTDYYNTDGGGRWSALVTEDPVSQNLQEPTVYRAGKVYREDWNRAVFGPAVGKPTHPLVIPARTGDVIHAGVSLSGDGAGRAGAANLQRARTALYRDGVAIGDVGEPFADFTVPAQDGRYRLEAEWERAAGVLSTVVSGVWTFRSAHTDGTVRLPLSTVTFSPKVDDHNTAPAGQAFSIPVTVAAQPDSAAGKTRRLGVEVSYDDGQTWQRAPVASHGGKYTVQVNHPAGTGFVSLRASAEDDRGNTVAQTVIRSYRFG